MKKLLDEAFEAGKKLGKWIETGRDLKMPKPIRFEEWYNNKAINRINELTKSKMIIVIDGKEYTKQCLRDYIARAKYVENNT